MLKQPVAQKNYLLNKLGPVIQNALKDDEIFEIMLNPDSKLWLTHRTDGNIYAGNLDNRFAESFVNALAQHENKFLNHTKPYLDAVLPFNGERINVTIPPIVENVSFNIRKKAKVVFTLDDYVNSKIMTVNQAGILTKAIKEEKNILVSGSPGSGKTTLTNALLDCLAKITPKDRVLLLEQVSELQCPVENLKCMVTTDVVNMARLLWICLRNTPQRIIIGEARDGAILDLLKAWNTGCRGGIATIHANNTEAAIQRVLDLAMEVVPFPPYALAAEALDIIVQIDANSLHPAGRQVTGIIEVTGFDRNTNTFQTQQLDEGEIYEKAA